MKILLCNQLLWTVAAPYIFAEAVAACSSDTGGTTYNVGPNQQYATIGAVPLANLSPGDWICIYPGTYGEKFVINRSGTAAAPIVVKGVRDAVTGDLPVIDGSGAVTPLYLDYWGENRNLIKIGGASYPSPASGGIVEYVRVESLLLRNARNEAGITYTSDSGASGQTYANNAACVHIEQGHHIQLIGNEITGCGNGIFVTPGNSGDILVEKNYIHGNGHSGSIYEHNVYTETNGIVYKYNRFGPLCLTCGGNNLKDRSAGLIIAYNFIEGGNRQLDIVDSTYYNDQPMYDDTHVYGNILIETNVNNGNRQMVHYGGDSSDTTMYRTGTLHFYHNTLLSTRSGKTTLVRLSSDQTSMDARNNIIYSTSNDIELLAEKRGTLYLRNNWLRGSLGAGYIYWVEALFNGNVFEEGTVLESTTGRIFSESGFSTVPYDLHLMGSLLLGTTLASGATPINTEYVYHNNKQTRSNQDLGAFSFGPVVATPEPTAMPTYSGFCSDGSNRCLIGGDASTCSCFTPGSRKLMQDRQTKKDEKLPSIIKLRRRLPRKPTSPVPPPTPPPTSPPTKAPIPMPTLSPIGPVSCECWATDSPTKSPTRRPSNKPTKSPSKSPTKSPTPCWGQGTACSTSNDNCCNGCRVSGSPSTRNTCQ